ncbi:hypothetical protein ACTXQV_22565, partial [Klebsiella pneumoniae]
MLICWFTENPTFKIQTFYWAANCVWLPGNHDFQPAMYSTLQEA